MIEEVWKNIEGYEGCYQVSNLGRIKSLARNSKLGNASLADIFKVSQATIYAVKAGTIWKGVE